MTSVRNPLNSLNPFNRPMSAIGSAQKAISLERIEDDRPGHREVQRDERTPSRAPAGLSLRITSPANLLEDPWGNAYKYLQRPERYLVIGFAPDGKADTDLFLSRAIDIGPTTPSPTSRPDTGGIQLIE